MQLLYLILCLHVSILNALPVLSLQEVQKLATKIRRNECGLSSTALTCWKSGEQWASMGIGHFIWYPAGHTALYTERFPALLNYLHHHNIALPTWLYNKKPLPCPWNSKIDFDNNLRSKKILELRQLLQDTQDLQAQFIVDTFYQQMQELLQTLSKRERHHVEHQLNRLTASAQGMYAVIDYANFKGFGTNPHERYQNKGWGLLQVLQAMHGSTTGDAAIEEFAQQAKQLLTQRIAHAPANRNEQQWIAGWHNRIDTYTK